MYIVCVTSYPVGIAHTYMITANLEKAVKAKGYEMEVEIQGTQDVENEVITEDIGRVDGRIITSDVRIRNSGRFELVSTLTVGASEAVKNARTIVEELPETIS